MNKREEEKLKSIIAKYIRGNEKKANIAKDRIKKLEKLDSDIVELEKKNKYKSVKNEIRKLICEKKEWFFLLSRKHQLLAHLICEVPIMYPILYRIYAKILLKNKYV